MTKYLPDEYWSVIYINTGKKKCDCGSESDAMSLVLMNPKELTYVKNTNYIMGPVVDIEPQKSLPTSQVIITDYPTINTQRETLEETFVLCLREAEGEPLNLI